MIKPTKLKLPVHAADHRIDLFKEIHRVLKPGALFGGYEWVLTDKYDASNEHHKHLKFEIEFGNGISNLTLTEGVKSALEGAGFEVLELHDRALDCDPETPWYYPLTGEGLNIKQIRRSPIGRFVMRNLIKMLMWMGVLPKSTLEVSKMLNRAGEALVEAGKEEIFYPNALFPGEKKVILGHYGFGNIQCRPHTHTGFFIFD